MLAKVLKFSRLVKTFPRLLDCFVVEAPGARPRLVSRTTSLLITGYEDRCMCVDVCRCTVPWFQADTCRLGQSTRYNHRQAAPSPCTGVASDHTTAASRLHITDQLHCITSTKHWY